MSAEIPIVDLNDTVIGYRPRADVALGEIYRVTSLTVVNPIGRILLAQRALSKKINPGTWSPAVTGTVERGETYDSNIEKEALEELGVQEATMHRGPKLFLADNGHGRGWFCQTYVTVLDRPADAFTLQPEEVAAVKWVEADWVSADVAQHPEDYSVNFAMGLLAVGPAIAGALASPR